MMFSVVDRATGRVVFSATPGGRRFASMTDEGILRAHYYDPAHFSLKRVPYHTLSGVTTSVEGLPVGSSAMALIHDGGYGDMYDAGVIGAAIRNTRHPDHLALYAGREHVKDYALALRYRGKPVFDQVVITTDGWDQTVAQEHMRWGSFYDWRPYVGRMYDRGVWYDVPGGEVERAAAAEILTAATNRLQFTGRTVHELGFESLYLSPVSPSEVTAEIGEVSSRWGAVTAQPYLTVANGSDAGTGRRLPQTKEWEPMSWSKVVEEMPLPVYQVGLGDEEPIEGAVSLLGRTNINEALFLLARSSLHLSVENGAVRMAYSVGTRSVVVYGPTPPSLYGLPGNVVVRSEVCSPCLWLTKDWMWDCPKKPELDRDCIRAVAPSLVIEAALEALR